jgi:ribosome biogenesis GTPase A
MARLRASSEQSVPFIEWQQQYSDSDRRKQVIAIEKAALSSKMCLEHMKGTLAAESHKGLARMCQLWKDRIGKVLLSECTWSGITFLANINTYLEEVTALPKSHEVLVGVRGMTGSGKSTLINAILRMKDLLPTNSSQACTAVPVEVAYNYGDDDRGPFLAEIQFATRDQWKRS